MLYLRNRSALAVSCCVIIHSLEVSCEDQITSSHNWPSNSELNNSCTIADLFRFEHTINDEKTFKVFSFYQLSDILQ